MFVGFYTFFWTYSSKKTMQNSEPMVNLLILPALRLELPQGLPTLTILGYPPCKRMWPARAGPASSIRRREVAQKEICALTATCTITHPNGAKGPKANSRQNQTKAFGDFESTGRFRDFAAISGRFFFLSESDSGSTLFSSSVDFTGWNYPVAPSNSHLFSIFPFRGKKSH